MSFYEKKILPKVLDLLCGSSPINYQRKKIVPKVSGNVLEIGIGSGLNLPHYNVSNISNITALDPDLKQLYCLYWKHCNAEDSIQSQFQFQEHCHLL